MLVHRRKHQPEIEVDLLLAFPDPLQPELVDGRVVGVDSDTAVEVRHVMLDAFDGDPEHLRCLLLPTVGVDRLEDLDVTTRDVLDDVHPIVRQPWPTHGPTLPWWNATANVPNGMAT
jgi:hypothetical protein